MPLCLLNKIERIYIGGRSRRGGRSSRRGSSRPEEPTGQEHSTVFETGQRSDDPKRKGKAIDLNVAESDTDSE
uniref:Uncharacterized protein n=1 Tax=Meloidogyne enterolobii TaxID=390850 RepID=A0A6V7WIG3_MELEN|nr:unnamed protein product [Meloidogyne enterolobii]